MSERLSIVFFRSFFKNCEIKKVFNFFFKGKKKNNEFPNIYHCLEKFFEEEMINEYKCNFCKKSSRSRKTMKIAKLPRVLLVHLKRFKMYPRKQKIADKIEFPIAGLDLKKFLFIIKN